MTMGKIVLELLIYAKSAIRKFRPIRGLHSKSHDHKTRDKRGLQSLITLTLNNMEARLLRSIRRCAGKCHEEHDVLIIKGVICQDKTIGN